MIESMASLGSNMGRVSRSWYWIWWFIAAVVAGIIRRIDLVDANVAKNGPRVSMPLFRKEHAFVFSTDDENVEDPLHQPSAVFLVMALRSSLDDMGVRRRQAIRSTWAKQREYITQVLKQDGVELETVLKTPVAFLVNCSSMEDMDFHTQRESKKYQDLWCLENPTLRRILWKIHQEYRSSFVYLAGDSIYLRVEALVKALYRFQLRGETSVYGGMLEAARTRSELGIDASFYPIESIPPYLSTKHIVISFIVIEFIAENHKLLRDIPDHDGISLAIWLLALRVPVTSIEEFRTTETFFQNSTSCEQNDFVSLADLSPLGIHQIHSRVQSQQGICQGFKLDWLDPSVVAASPWYEEFVGGYATVGQSIRLSDDFIVEMSYQPHTQSKKELLLAMQRYYHVQPQHTQLLDQAMRESAKARVPRHFLKDLFSSHLTSLWNHNVNLLHSYNDENDNNNNNKSDSNSDSNGIVAHLWNKSLGQENVNVKPSTSVAAVVRVSVSAGAMYARRLIESVMVSAFPTQEVLVIPNGLRTHSQHEPPSEVPFLHVNVFSALDGACECQSKGKGKSSATGTSTSWKREEKKMKNELNESNEMNESNESNELKDDDDDDDAGEMASCWNCRRGSVTKYLDRMHRRTKGSKPALLVLIWGEAWPLPVDLPNEVVLWTTDLPLSRHRPLSVYLPVVSSAWAEMLAWQPLDLLHRNRLFAYKKRPFQGFFNSFATRDGDEHEMKDEIKGDYVSTQPTRKFCAYLYARCDRPIREDFFNLLSSASSSASASSPEHSVDALGHCQGKGRLPQPALLQGRGKRWWHDEAIALFTSYKFVVAFENAVEPKGYVTEKILLAFLAGSIPIYYGSDYVNEVFNPKSFINCRTGFPTLQACVDYVVHVHRNATLYEAILQEPIATATQLQTYFGWHPQLFETNAQQSRRGVEELKSDAVDALEACQMQHLCQSVRAALPDALGQQDRPSHQQR